MFDKMSFHNGEYSVDLEWIGEGRDGDYHENDPHDEKLIRFTAYCNGEPINNGSYCTQLPVDTPEKMLSEFGAALAKMAPTATKRDWELMSWAHIKLVHCKQ